MQCVEYHGVKKGVVENPQHGGWSARTLRSTLCRTQIVLCSDGSQSKTVHRQCEGSLMIW